MKFVDDDDHHHISLQCTRWAKTRLFLKVDNSCIRTAFHISNCSVLYQQYWCSAFLSTCTDELVFNEEIKYVN